MREDICSIPVNDVFLPKEGCPFCRMRDMLEDRMATYITPRRHDAEPDGAGGDQPPGLLHRALQQILARGSRLSVALILESLLQTVHDEVFPAGKAQPKKAAAAVHSREEHCFVCENIEKNTAHLLDSTLKLWQTDGEFRQLYSQQPYICLRHYGQVLQAAAKMPKKNFVLFEEVTTGLAKRYLEELNADVTHFCRMFDYRNAGGDWGNSKDSIERAIRYLTSREPENRQKADEKNRAF